jgi:hypothetical protein
MRFPPTVIQAEHCDEHRIHLEFNDGVENTVDFSSRLDGPVFAPLKAPEYFQPFFLEGGTIRGRTVLTSRPGLSTSEQSRVRPPNLPLERRTFASVGAWSSRSG